MQKAKSKHCQEATREICTEELGQHYHFLNSWATDGICAFHFVTDSTQKPSPKSGTMHLSNIENKLEELREAGGTSQFEAIVGIDLGHVYSAAAFALPTDSSKPGTQLKVSNAYLYGHQQQNSRLLEKMKAKTGIVYLEEELGKHTKHGATLMSWVNWVRAWQDEK